MEHTSKLQAHTEKKHRMDTRQMVILSLLTAMAFLSMFVIKVPVVLFLKYEPKDVFITLGGFLYGPLAVVLMSLTTSFVEMMTISDTGPIGLLMNVVSTVAYAGTAAFVFRKLRSLAGAYLGLAIGSVAMTALMLLWNYLITPMYMGTPREVVAQMLVPAFLPFNLIKAGVNTALTMLLFTPLHRILKELHADLDFFEDRETHKSKVLTIVVAVFLLLSGIYAILAKNGIL